jgi:phosphonopyruvate decarboxylase
MGQGHESDFLSVGSMGHASSVALGIALSNPAKRIWCVDGDGAMIMHMGAMAAIGGAKPGNLIHVVLNNASHESVGGMPTAAGGMDIPMIAIGCGYPRTASAESLNGFREGLMEAKRLRLLSLVEAKCSIGARADLGRPKMAPRDAKVQFMKYLKKE